MSEASNPFTEAVLSISNKYRTLLESSTKAQVDPFMMETLTSAQREQQQIRQLRATYGDRVMDQVMARRKNGK